MNLDFNEIVKTYSPFLEEFAALCNSNHLESVLQNTTGVTFSRTLFNKQVIEKSLKLLKKNPICDACFFITKDIVSIYTKNKKNIIIDKLCNIKISKIIVKYKYELNKFSFKIEEIHFFTSCNTNDICIEGSITNSNIHLSVYTLNSHFMLTVIFNNDFSLHTISFPNAQLSSAFLATDYSFLIKNFSYYTHLISFEKDIFVYFLYNQLFSKEQHDYFYLNNDIKINSHIHDKYSINLNKLVYDNQI